MDVHWKAKHKDLAANARGHLFGKLAHDITIAARHSTDPTTISRLRVVTEQARKVPMPEEAEERAIKKWAGLDNEAVHFEQAVYEDFASRLVPAMVECLTDSLNRAASEMGVPLRQRQRGSSGSVYWDLEHIAMVEAEPASAGADESAAIEAVAQDLVPGDEGVTLFATDPSDLALVSRALPAQGFTVPSAKLGYRPKSPIDPARLMAEQRDDVERLRAAIDASVDVRNVYAGLQG